MDFEKAVKIVIDLEGGEQVSRDPHDRGGVTKFGISKRSYPHLDIENLTYEEAVEIYRKDFWGLLDLEKFPEHLRLTVFDSSVNQGVGGATGMLQAILSLKIDGVMGPKTLAKVQSTDTLTLLKHFTKMRHLRYKRDPKWVRYGAGWSDRLLEISIRTYENIIKG